MMKLILSAVCLAACLVPVSGANLPGLGETLEFPVGDQFKYRINLYEETAHYSVYELKYPSPDPENLFGDIRALYYLPLDIAGGGQNLKPRPAVLVLHILGGNGALSNMFCADLASKGIPAMMFYMPTYSARSPGGSRHGMLKRPDGGELFVRSLELSLQEVSRAVDLLQGRPEINPAKINLIGTSLGGIIGAAALSREPRIDKAVILLGGGNIGRIIGHSQETFEMRQALDNVPAERKKSIAESLARLDPLSGAEKLRPLADSGRLLLYNAENDEVVPLECSKEFAEKCGMKDKIRIIPGVGHYTAIVMLPQILSDFTAFFGDATVPEPKPAPESSDQAVIRDVFRQLSRLLKFNPEPEHCFFIDADFDYSEDGKSVAKGSLTAVRGDGNRYKLLFRGDKLPVKVKTLFTGYDTAPWIVTENGSVFRGTLEPEGKSPADFFDPRVRMYRDMAAGIFDMAALGLLEPLKKFCSLTLQRDAAGNRRVEVNIENKEFIHIALKPGTTTPARLDYKSRKGAVCEVVFKNWMLDAPADPRLFAPEAAQGSPVSEVSERDLNRVTASGINFLIEGATGK